MGGAHARLGARLRAAARAHRTRRGGCRACSTSSPSGWSGRRTGSTPKGLPGARSRGRNASRTGGAGWSRSRGWDESGRPGSIAYRERDLEAFKAGGPLLYVGRFTAVKAYRASFARTRACARYERRAPLVLLGGFPGEWEGEHLLAAAGAGPAPAMSSSPAGVATTTSLGLNAADLLVLPSVREQFGAVLVEAMACGLPVLAVDAHGPAEIVDAGETGRLVPPDDEDALAAALVEAVNGPCRAPPARRSGLRGGSRALRLARARARFARLRRGARRPSRDCRNAHAGPGLAGRAPRPRLSRRRRL